MVRSAKVLFSEFRSAWGRHRLQSLILNYSLRIAAKKFEGEFAMTIRVSKVSPRTLNLEHAYVLGVFNELKRIEGWNAPNPLENVRQFRNDESEMSYLKGEQIKTLLHECRNSNAKDLEIIVRIFWLPAQDGVKEKTKAFTDCGRKDNVYKNQREAQSYNSLIERIVRGITKEKWKHFTTYFRKSLYDLNGGNILVLQKIFGHSYIKTTMRYAHFSPRHLQDALKSNPLNGAI